MVRLSVPTSAGYSGLSVKMGENGQCAVNSDNTRDYSNFSITGRFVSVALSCLPAEVGLAQLLAEIHLGGQAGQRYR